MAILRNALFMVLTGLATPVLAASEDSAELLHRADQAVQVGLQQSEDSQKARTHFWKAAQCYEEIRQQGIRNPKLFRDQGNAYLLAGDVAHAILAYRRGLRLEPGDRVIQANLTYAREQVDYPASDRFGRPALDDWPPWLPRPTPAVMLAFAFIVYGAGCLLLTRSWMTRRGWLLTAAVASFVLTIVPIVGLAHEAWRERSEEKHPLVVIASDGVPLRNGNGMAYPARYDGKTLNRGVEARLLFERGEWLHVELAGGETGWVRRADALVDTR